MITDIFARRYEAVPLRPQYFEEDRRFLNQSVTLIGNSLWAGHTADKVADATEAGLKIVHDAIALELGRDVLSDQWWWQKTTWNGNTSTVSHKNTYATMVKAFLVALPPDVTNADRWIKERLSLVELAYRYRAAYVASANNSFPAELTKAELQDKVRPAGRMVVPGTRANGMRAVNRFMNERFAASVSELNERMRLAGYRLHYHNGFIQLADDDLLGEEVAKPFWDLVTDSRFANVDLQIKEAIDRRDRGDRTSAFHAVCALESCIKIICEIKSWTTGNERGAANYIDHLISKGSGGFIEPWEGKALKEMFTDVRNPFAHGPGQAPMPTLTPEQTQWSIDTAMTWSKALLTRLNG